MIIILHSIESDRDRELAEAVAADYRRQLASSSTAAGRAMLAHVQAWYYVQNRPAA